jgi:heme oxygenase
MKNRFTNMPTRMPFTSQNPYIEHLGMPDTYMLPLDAHVSNKTLVANTLATVKSEWHTRLADALAKGGGPGKEAPFPSRLPDIWMPQKFVNRLSTVMQRASYCGSE